MIKKALVLLALSLSLWACSGEDQGRIEALEAENAGLNARIQVLEESHGQEKLALEQAYHTAMDEVEASRLILEDRLVQILRETLPFDKASLDDTNVKIIQTKGEAVEFIEAYIASHNIVFDTSGIENQFWDFQVVGDDIYYVMRGAYIDPSNRDYTSTIYRYYINAMSHEVLREDLGTGELYKEFE